MKGLSRFNFYPRDWLGGTRELSMEARGAYCDLLAMMYDAGGPIPYDLPELRARLGLASIRVVRRLLDELIQKGKITVAEDRLTNDRAMAEIDAAHRAIEKAAEYGRMGGRPRKVSVSETNEELSAELGGNFGEVSLKLDSDIEEKQGVSKTYPSPLPPPSPVEEREVSLSHAVDAKPATATATVTAIGTASQDTASEREPGLPLGEEPASGRKLSGKVAAAEIDAVFDRFWQAFPRRHRANPKQESRTIFARAVRAGVNGDVIVHAAERYAKEMLAEGKVGTQWVAQTTTWLNQKRWGDYTADNVHTGNFGESQTAESEPKMDRKAWRDPKNPPPSMGEPRGTRRGLWLMTSNGWVLDR